MFGIRFGRVFAAVVASLAVGCMETTPERRPSAVEVARVCAGISEAEARATLEELRPDVEYVDVVRQATRTKPVIERTVGVDVYVRAKRGMTAEWMSRLVDCHMASENVGVACTSAACPLHLAHVSTRVTSTADAFRIAIRSDDPKVAREIVQRSKLVFEPASSPTVAVTPQH